MDKRHEERIKSYITCELVSRSLNFSGWIEDFAEDGLCVLIAPTKAVEDIPAGMLFMVKIISSSGNTVEVECRVKQAYKTSADGPTNNVGMEIIDKTPTYMEFLKTKQQP